MKTRAEAEAAARDLVGANDIAHRYGIARQSVWNWTYRHADFPKPVGHVGGGSMWWWTEVAAWLKATGRM